MAMKSPDRSRTGPEPAKTALPNVAAAPKPPGPEAEERAGVDRVIRRGGSYGTFLIWSLEAEGFVIPTGSMAPTLMGRHKELLSARNAKYTYTVNAEW